MIETSKFRGFVIGLLWIIIGSTLVGCQGILLTFKGKAVAPEARIVLKEGSPHNGVWETDEMVFKYDYSWESGNFEMSGDLALNDSMWAFSRIEYIFFWVHFIDKNGKLIESKVAGSSAGSWADNGTSVKFNMDTPPGTAAISFSYMGRVWEDGGDSTNWSLWKSPLG